MPYRGTQNDLGTFATDTTSELDVLRHDGHTLGVNGAQVRIFKETHQVGLTGFLQGEDGRGLLFKEKREREVCEA